MVAYGDTIMNVTYKQQLVHTKFTPIMDINFIYYYNIEWTITKLCKDNYNRCTTAG